MPVPRQRHFLADSTSHASDDLCTQSLASLFSLVPPPRSLAKGHDLRASGWSLVDQAICAISGIGQTMHQMTCVHKFDKSVFLGPTPLAHWQKAMI